MSSPGRVLVTGATGLVGGRLLPRLVEAGWQVEGVTRRPERTRLPSGCTAVGWDGVRLTPEVLSGAAAVVHLAGEPVFAGRLDAKRRTRIRDSRIVSTRELVRSLGELTPGERPGVLVCASAVGYYGSRGEEVLDESAAPGDGFLAEVCIDWEGEAAAAEAIGVRVVSLRIGIVLAAEGGALQRMAIPFRLGLGGRLGSGRQWFPWIHADDMAGLIVFALGEPAATGAINATAPHPVRNQELTRELASVLHRPAIFAVPAFALRIALGELSDELLGSRRVVPGRAEALGYRFAQPRIAEALTAELAASGS